MTTTYFFSMKALRAMLFTQYPEMAQVPWIDDALNELWQAGTPHPKTWERRMIKPSDWKRFAHDVAQRIGREVNAKPSG